MLEKSDEKVYIKPLKKPLQEALMGMEKSNILEKVKNTIARVESSAEIILYGSRAREDYHEGSDWDFLVLLDGNVDYARSDRVRHQLHEIEWDTGEILCAIVRSRG